MGCQRLQPCPAVKISGINRSPVLQVGEDVTYGDIFTRKFDIKFDLIICFSTFHYFIDKQKEFLDLCHSYMNENGIFLLEVEEYPLNDKATIDKTPRPADKIPYDYPNKLMMEEFCKNKFNVSDRYISTFQGGALYDRYFYKLEKI